MHRFAHAIAVFLTHGSDARAIGGAVTVALCGRWDHEGPCRWPHLTTVVARRGDEVEARVDFTCGDDEEDEVRRRIAAAIHTGRLEGPTGIVEWRVLREGPSSDTDRA